MLTLCLMLLATYYAQNYASIIGWSLVGELFIKNEDGSLDHVISNHKMADTMSKGFKCCFFGVSKGEPTATHAVVSVAVIFQS